MAEDKKPLGQKGIGDLIALMEANNKSTKKIEVDGRNTRRHLLEIKNMQKVMNDFQARTVFGFENFQDMINSQSLQGEEKEKERLTIFEEIRDSLQDIAASANKSSNAKGDSSGGGGGLLGGLGLALGGLGKGAMGIALMGAAIPAFFGAMAAGDYGLKALDVDLSFSKIKEAALGFSDIITAMPTEGWVALGAIMAAASYSGNPAKAALGMSLMGAAIPGFFGGLSAGNYALDVLNVDLSYSKIKEAAAGFSSIIQDISPEAGTALVALLGVGGLAGAVKGVGGAAGVAAGMTAMGAGIGGFFSGLALGELALDALGSNFGGIKNAVKGFDDAIQEFTDEGLAKFLVLIGAGGVVGKLAGAKGSFDIAAGMTALGTGIGGFFAGFSLGGYVSSKMGDGSQMVPLVKNFQDSIGALDAKSLAALGAFMITGAGLALFTGGVGSAVAAAGIGAMGASLAAFFVAFDGVGRIGGALGIDGSSMKTLFGNLAEGINSLTSIDATGASLISLGAGLGALGIGIAGFLGLEGLGGVISTVTDIGGGIKDFFFGNDGKSIFDEIAESIKPIIGLNDNNALTAFNEFTKSMIDITSTRGVDAASDSWERFGDSVLGAAQKMQLAFEGGTLGDVALAGIANYKSDIEGLSTNLQNAQNEISSEINVNAQAIPTLASLYVNTLSAENALLKLPQASGGDTLAVSQRGGDNIRTGDTIVISQTNKDLIEESINNSR